MSDEEDKERYIIVWADGEYCYDEQYEENPDQPLGYAKSDDHEKVVLSKGLNYVDINGMTLTVELDYWNNVWERELFATEEWNNIKKDK